ncbi:MAG: VWA domain-containing protein [Gemmatimonadales bacterium]|nr:VWA domain-containing protein [Gemmatimonadales bacterium]NIN48798.1 VWA domain-containing protein [Gemmatimonadales bacterium]NIP06262.1 VWA domain-containing protein [Gemmatimonadales bacterium]NIR00149.1 VWA domain-containing protein [Gemmatimonadales bacterium]NIS64552.1 VWA domain-containing protein [Gemmatimonadales bacterium]
MSFDIPVLLWAAPVVGLVVALLASWARAARVGRARRWSETFGKRAAALGRFSPAALGLVAVAATAALAGPRWGSRVVETQSKGLNLVVAVDISRSMLAEDVGPSRLERAKRQARRLVHDLAGDRIGLMVFAGQSFVLSPLTVDAGALRLLIDALDPEMMSAGGTEFAPVLRRGRELLFAGDPVADRVLVVFTDGEAHDSLSAIVSAAERLHRDGVRLVLVAEGGREPAPIPVRDPQGVLIGYQRDPSEQIVSTWRRDDILTAVADGAHGVLVAAPLNDQAGAVRDLVAAYKRSPQATSTAAQDISRAWIPVLVAVVLLLLHTVSRRSMALTSILLLVSVGSAAEAQGPRNRADEAWQQGEFRRAAGYYLEQVQAGAGGDTTLFNLGTAGLVIGDTAVARQALEQAARSVEPELRFRALYNLGLLHLRLAQRDSAHATPHLEAARRRYREALLLKPGDRAAKWNLELAIRRMPEGGGASAPPPEAGGAGESSREEPPPRGLSLAQADQILNSMAEEERRTRMQQIQQRRRARETRGRKEW